MSRFKIRFIENHNYDGITFIDTLNELGVIRVERNKLIDRLGRILIRDDNGEEYLVTGLGFSESSDSELTFNFVMLKSLSSQNYFETNDFEVLQKLFNISDISDLQRYFSDGEHTYIVVECSSTVVVVRKLNYDFKTRDIQTIEIYEDLNDLMINGGYSQRYGFCSLDYFMKNFHELTTDEHLYCNNTEGIPLNSF